MGLFKSKDERRIEREIKIRQGIRAIERSIRQQEKFSDDFIRPGFTQEAQYDLATDPVIGFKGARIEVLEATNTRLRYKVLKSFPDLP